MGRCERNLKPVRILRSSGVNSSSRSGRSAEIDSLAAQQQCLLAFEHRVFFLLQVFFDPLEPALDLVEIGEHQLEIQRDGVAQRIDAAGRMRHGRIVEHAQHVCQRVHFAQRRQHRGIPRAALGHATDVDVLHGGIGHFARLVERGELIDARFGDAWPRQYAWRHVPTFRPDEPS